jgi:hypothetical protein
VYQVFRNKHYISNNGCHGQQLHYLILEDAKPIGIISGASAVYSVKARDEFFDLSKDKDTKHAQLSSIINNVVYRLESSKPNQASSILAKWRKQIAKDWQFLYQTPVAGFETFVIEGNQNDAGEVCTDRIRKGSLYLADNWSCVGSTAGNTKSHSAATGSGGLLAASTRKDVCSKLIFVKKVKGVIPSTTYQSSWRDASLQKELQRRRNLLFSENSNLIEHLST